MKHILKTWKNYMNESVQKNKKIASCVVVINPKNEILLLKRVPWANFPSVWGFPGGGADAGESPEQGAKRELYEETGLLSGELNHFFTKRKENKEIHFFTCKSYENDIDLDKVKYEHTEFRWINPNDLDHYEKVPDTEFVIRKAFGTREVL